MQKAGLRKKTFKPVVALELSVRDRQPPAQVNPYVYLNVKLNMHMTFESKLMMAPSFLISVFCP